MYFAQAFGASRRWSTRSFRLFPTALSYGTELKHYGPSAIKEPIQVDKVGRSTRSRQSCGVSLRLHPPPETRHDPPEGAPWRQAKKKGGRIPNDVIETYYEGRWVEETKALMQQLAQDPEFQEEVRRGIARIESGEGVCYTEDELEEIIESRSGLASMRKIIFEPEAAEYISSLEGEEYLSAFRAASSLLLDPSVDGPPSTTRGGLLTIEMTSGSSSMERPQWRLTWIKSAADTRPRSKIYFM